MKHNIETYEYLFSQLATGSRTWRIAIYVRLSKEDGRGKSVSLSIENQIKLMSIFLERLSDFMIYDIYIDDGLTGTNFERNDYQRLQLDIESKKVNCVIVKDLTRFVRNVADGIKELDSYVLERNIRFISCGNPKRDTRLDPHAITSPAVYSALQNAEDVARSTSEKVRDVQEVKRRFGEPTGGYPQYGFEKNPDPNNKNWVIDPVAGKIRADMLQWSLEGMTDTQIAKKLNDLKILNPTAYKQQVQKLNYKNPQAKKNSGLWWPSTVSRYVSDEANIGCMVQHKSESFDHKRPKQKPVPKEEQSVRANCHDKLIDEETFYTIQEVRKVRHRSTKESGKPHIFSKLVYCADCKRAMKKTAAKGYKYLVCRTYKELGKEYCSTKRTISFKTLEDVVLRTIQSQIALVMDLRSVVNTINERPNIINQSVRINKLIHQVEQDILDKEHMVDLLYFDWKHEEISKEQYQRVRNDVEKSIENLRDSLQMLLSEQQIFKQEVKANNEYFSLFLKYRNIQKLDRLVLVDLIERIYIHADKMIQIEFKYNDQFLLIQEYIQENNSQKKLIKK